MHFLNEGDSIEVKGSGKKPYVLKKTGGVVDCSCPAWRNLGGNIDVRVCKHIRANIDKTCLLPQAHAMYDNKAVKPAKGASGAAKPAAIKKDTAPPVLLAHPWTGEDPVGWWMSEKLDGVRAWWDGEKFLSRLGNVYHAPDWFKELLPKNMVLDGELFVGRRQFQKTVSTVRKLVPTDSEWQNVTYVVFDAPEVKEPFEKRLALLEKTFPKWLHKLSKSRVCYMVHRECPSAKALAQFLSAVELDGGEGVMLRKAGSLYEEGRSSSLLKVKTFKDDEAVVTKHIPGRGRHKGRLGALWVKWNGLEFKIGTGFSDKERENPPKIGSVVTFHYTDLTTAGIPKCAGFLSVRDYE